MPAIRASPHLRGMRPFPHWSGEPAGAVTGEGLGLTLVRSIIERHHGRVWLESEPGQGSRLWFNLQREPWEAME